MLTWTRDGESFLVDSQGIRFPLREGISIGSTPVVEAAGDPPFAFKQEAEDGLSLRNRQSRRLPDRSCLVSRMQEQAKPLLPPEFRQVEFCWFLKKLQLAQSLYMIRSMG